MSKTSKNRRLSNKNKQFLRGIRDAIDIGENGCKMLDEKQREIEIINTPSLHKTQAG